MGMDRLTLFDIAMQLDPDGMVAKIVGVLNESNPILQDAPAYPSNNRLGNRVTMDAALPTVYWRKLNQGTTRSKGATRQVEDTIGFLTGRSEVDRMTVHIHGSQDIQQVRFNESKRFLESMSKTVASTMLYGDEGADESAFTGLQPRLETAATAITGSQVKKHHGSPSGSDYTSIYIVDWHEDYVHLIYPPDSQAGIMSEDLGLQQVDDADGNPFTAYVQEYTWLIGLTVKDPRHIARLANIDVSQALADTSTLLTNSLIQMLNRMPSKNGAKRVMYCSRNILSSFELQTKSLSNVLFTWADYLGELTLHFKGVPIRACDQMSEAESLIS